MSTIRSRSVATILATLLAALANGTAAAPYVVRGQVVTAEGALPSAEVRLIHRPLRIHLWPEDERERRVLEPIRTQSDEDGRFEVNLDPGEIDSQNARWLLEISAPALGRRILQIPPDGHQARGGATEELGGILLSPGRLIRGRAVSAAPGEAPLAGVRVSLWRSFGGTPRPWTATTATDGSFAILDVPAGEYIAVLDQPGFAPHQERPTIPRLSGRASPGKDRATPAPVDLGTIALAGALTLRGRVVDAASESLAGVRVRYRHDLPPGARDGLPAPEAETGPRGEFRLDGMPPEPGTSYHFRFEKQGFRWRHVELEIVPDAGGLRLAAPVALAEALVLEGRVSDPSGKPIAGAQVRKVRDGEVSGIVEIHPTDAGGRFRIDGVEGTTRLHIEARGFVATEVEVEARPELDRAQPLPIALEPAATTDLTITVHDARGRPVGGAEVSFSSHDDRGSSYHETVLTDDAGRCQLDQVPLGGPCSLEVRHLEHPHWRRSDLVVEAGQRSLAVDLDPAPWKLETVRGRLIDGEGDPVPGAEVSLSPPSGSPQYRVRAGGGGRFELRRVKEGAYRLFATAPGRAPATRRVKVTVGMAPIELALGAGASLRGSIGGVTPEESAELGARIWAHWTSAHWTGMQEGTVDGDSYRIDHLGAGKWSVTASVGNSQVEAEIEIEPGQTEARLDFELPSGHRVRGHLLIDGRPPPEAWVSLQTTREAPASSHYSARADSEGRFVFDRVVAGPYHLSYHNEAGGIRHAVLVDSDADLLLDLHTTMLRGRVVDTATGDGVAGVPVQAFPEVQYSHGPRWEAITGSAGWFELGRVLAGPWTLFVKAPGFLERRLEASVDATAEPPIVELVASEGLRVRVERFRLPPSGGTSAALPYSVKLELRDPDGERVARGSVTLAGAREGHWSEAPRGRFRLRASNDLTWIETDVEIPGPVVTLRFPPAGALRLRVPELELESEVPWRPAVPVQVEATLEVPDDPAFDGPRCRRSRFLSLKSLAPGRWRIEVSAADGRVWIGSAWVVDGRSSEILLGME